MVATGSSKSRLLTKKSMSETEKQHFKDKAMAAAKDDAANQVCTLRCVICVFRLLWDA